MTTVKKVQCFECKHVDMGGKGFDRLTCDAFSSGIPDDIIYGIHDHRKPYPHDNGIRFEKK